MFAATGRGQRLLMLSDPTIDLVLRLVLASVAGAVIGFEREVRNHVAGVRTHAIVALGAALFAPNSRFMVANAGRATYGGCFYLFGGGGGFFLYERVGSGGPGVNVTAWWPVDVLKPGPRNKSRGPRQSQYRAASSPRAIVRSVRRNRF